MLVLLISFDIVLHSCSSTLAKCNNKCCWHGTTVTTLRALEYWVVVTALELTVCFSADSSALLIQKRNN